MQKTAPITSVSIDELISYTGRQKTVNDFHLFKSSELTKEKEPSLPVRIDHFIIILTLSGTAHVRLNLIDYHTEKNGLLIISPNTIHELVDKSPDNSFIAMGFIPQFLSQTGMNRKHADAFTFFSSQNDPYYLLEDHEATALSEIMLLLHEKDRYDVIHPFKDELISHAFNLFMYELAGISKTHRNETDFKITRKENILMSFFKILPLHFKEERSVQFYAGLLFITPKHLTKTVKELTNKTCGELIDEMVIIEAKLLLNDASLSVSNVADYLHFSDQFFFSKFFKKHTGFTPTEFRTTH
jgi:AraC family transcriptional activator of pobA